MTIKVLSSREIEALYLRSEKDSDALMDTAYVIEEELYSYAEEYFDKAYKEDAKLKKRKSRLRYESIQRYVWSRAMVMLAILATERKTLRKKLKAKK